MATQVYAGARDPEAITVTWVRTDPTFDTSTVTSGELHVSDGETTVVRPCEVVSRTESQVVLKHTFDPGGTETAEPGQYGVGTVLVLSSGKTRRGVPFKMTVLEYPRLVTT